MHERSHDDRGESDLVYVQTLVFEQGSQELAQIVAVEIEREERPPELLFCIRVTRGYLSWTETLSSR